MKAIMLIGLVTAALLLGAGGFRMLLTAQHHAEVGGPYALSDCEGHRVTQADFQGRYTVFYFGYTHCIDVCPLALATLSAALDRLGPPANGVVPIFVSVDPDRDTSAVIEQYVTRFSPRIVGLTGTQAQLKEVLDAFHVTVRKDAVTPSGYLIDHTSVLYVMDGQNHLAGMIPVDDSAEQMAVELTRILHRT